MCKTPGATGNVVTACDQVALEKEAASSAQLWKTQENYQDPLEDPETPQKASDDAAKLPRLNVQDVRAAAKSLPVNTGVGIDNEAPRAIDRLSDNAIEARIDVFQACEGEGVWGDYNTNVLTVLLPKPDGGVRPIGLLPTFIRIWSRDRMREARKWEADSANPCLFGGKDMGAQKAAWLASFRAEVTHLAQKEKIQTLLDMTNAFETIPHGKLVTTALKYGYNIGLLRLSIASYRLPRSTGCEGVQSALLTATRGITAGSGFATTELRILMQEVVLLSLLDWGESVNRTLYVDDLTIETEGRTEAAAGRNAAASDDICRILQEQVGFDISEKKSVVVASSPMRSSLLR